jgi:hypothetical protein
MEAHGDECNIIAGFGGGPTAIQGGKHRKRVGLLQWIIDKNSAAFTLL